MTSEETTDTPRADPKPSTGLTLRDVLREERRAKRRRTADSGSYVTVPLNLVDQVGAVGAFAVEVAKKAVTPPYSYGPELMVQTRLLLRNAFFPLMLVAFALSFGPAGVQASNFFGLFGAYDRMGAGWQLVVTRVLSPMATAIVIAGVAGASICADLGARVVREEMDALRVLGVEPVKNLVVPRVLVLALGAMLFNIFAMVSGMLGALLVLVQHGAPIAPFMSAWLSNASPVELGAAFVKVALFGGVIALTCCYNGLNASGGAEGVGRAVNRSVVTCFLAIGLIDYVFSAFVLATNPILSVPRG